MTMLQSIAEKGGALRGWLHDKRFVFWDEFEPVTFIAKGVMPKSQFLKAFNGQVFQIQMNQRTHDGNLPFKWNRGAVFTAKENGLWDLQGAVTKEDVGHMKSRVEIFRWHVAVRYTRPHCVMLTKFASPPPWHTCSFPRHPADVRRRPRADFVRTT